MLKRNCHPWPSLRGDSFASTYCSFPKFDNFRIVAQNKIAYKLPFFAEFIKKKAGKNSPKKIFLDRKAFKNVPTCKCYHFNCNLILST